MPKVPTEIGSLARSFTRRGIEILGGIAENCPDTKLRLEAIDMLFDRGWGKPSQEVQHANDETNELRVTIRHIMEGSTAPQK